MKRKIISIISLLILFYCTAIYAHDNILIHPALTEIAVSKSNIDQYIQDNLNFKDGLKTTFSASGKQNILQFLRQGSIDEDSPMCRAGNHFHDPLKSWDVSGRSDNSFLIGQINQYCNLRSWPSPYYSDITWATGLTSSIATPIPYNPGNNKSPNMWASARTLYYNALTAMNQTTRENNFAQMFKALGQVLHLLQDMSVPAHVRNDFESHLTYSGVRDVDGTYLFDPTKWFNNLFERYIKANSQLVNINPEELLYPTFTNPRLTDFWDTNKYTGTNPSNSTTLGLAEITNTNYLSDNTIPYNNPSTEHSYPFPKVDPQDYSICIDNEMETTDPRKYICRNDTSNPSGAISLINEESSITNDNISTFKLVLDNNVHDAFARELLPLAIGYSSSLLNYFFRGRMKVENMPVFEDQNNTLKELYVKVRNTTPTKETMVGNNDSSCFSLSWHYTPAGGGSDTYGSYPYCVYLDKPLPYGLDTNGNDIDDNTYTTTIIFDELDQIPNRPAISKTDYPNVEFTLTYLGTLGDEKMPPSNVPGQVTIAGAVIGKVFKPAESILFDEKWMTTPKGDNLVWSISSDSSGNAVDTTFINNFFYCPDTQHYTSYGCPSGCPSSFTNPQGKSTDTIVTANGGNLLMTNTANVIPGCDPSLDNRPGQGNIVMIGSNIGHYNCQGQYVTSGNSFNPVDSTNNFIFPMKITKNSYIQFRLDEMSISPAPPESNYTLAYQILEFQFNHGYVLQFFVGDQGIYNSNHYVGYFGFDLGYLTVENIYDLFAAWGFPTPPSDFQLVSIKIAQQALWNLPCNAAYTQKISIDNIRVGELKSMK